MNTFAARSLTWRLRLPRPPKRVVLEFGWVLICLANLFHVVTIALFASLLMERLCFVLIAPLWIVLYLWHHSRVRLWLWAWRNGFVVPQVATAEWAILLLMVWMTAAQIIFLSP